MTRHGLISLLLVHLLAGCATARVVRLDTGQGEPIVFTQPSHQEPVELKEEEFNEALVRLVLDLPMAVSPAHGRHEDWHGVPISCGADAQAPSQNCLSLLGQGFLLDSGGRRSFALSFAWDGVWDGVADAVKETINPLVLKAMITSAMTAYLVLLVAPEPVTKFIAIALSAYLVAYLGTGPVWEMVKAWKRLSEESERATSFEELKEAGHRFGQVMGANGTRVVILVAMAALGGRAGMAAKGPTLPGFAQAALAAETNAGFQLAAATAGGIRSIGITAGALNVGLAPTAVAAVVQQPGSGAAATSGSGQTNVWTHRTSAGGTRYRFNTGHGYNRPHESPGGISRDFSGTGLTADEIETAIMQQIESFRATGGTLPVPGTPGFNGPVQGSVSIGSHQVGFRAVLLNTGEIAVSTYFPL
jgi:hypothetical protein